MRARAGALAAKTVQRDALTDGLENHPQQ